MNKFVLKKKIFLLVSAFYLLYVTLPLVGQLLPLSATIVSIFVTVAVVFLCPNAFSNKPTFWLGLYLGILVLYVLFGKTLTISSISDEKANSFKLLMELAFILPSFTIMCGVNYFYDEKLTRFLFYTIILGLTISFLYLIPMTIINSNILRMALRTEYYEIDSVLGTPRYSLMHAYVIAVPPALFACMINTGRSKSFSVVFFVMLLYIIYRSYISTTTILSLGVLIFVYVRSSKTTNKFVFRIFVIIIFLLFLMVGGGKMLYDFSYSLFKGSYAQIKMDEIGMALSGNEVNNNSLTERENLHGISWNSFLKNPIFGYPKIGGHSNILDRLGGMGLVCFIPYFMLLISTWRFFDHQLFACPRSRFYYRIGVFIVFVLLYSKGLFSYEGWTFYSVILPVFALYLSQKEIQKQGVIQ